MAKGRVRLGPKNFFTLVVLSVSVLSLMFVTYASQKPTSTQSEATGDNDGSLTNCNVDSGRSGGIQLYNVILNQRDRNTESRIMCIPIQKTQTSSTRPDPNLGNIQSGVKYFDIWNFNNQAKSFTLRANRFCYIQAKFYDRPTYENLLYKSPIVGGTTNDRVAQISLNLPSEARGKATSLILNTECDFTRYFPTPTPKPFR